MIQANPPRKHIHGRDVFHAYLAEGVEFGPWDMPVVASEQRVPTRLVPFSVATSDGYRGREGFVHFCEDDCRFERLWRDPRRYLPRLREFDGAIGPDFSTCADMPLPLALWNLYRNHLLSAWLQRQGVRVIYLARMVEPLREASLAGAPREAPIAVCSRGSVSDPGKRELFVRTLGATVDELRPTRIVWYGSDAHGVADYPRSLGIPVVTYPARGRGGLGGGPDER